MVLVDAHWMGFLCNVDSSILSLKLPHGFTVDFLSQKEAFELLIKLEKIRSQMEFFQNYYLNAPILNEDEERLYFIHRLERLDIKMPKNGVFETIVIGETAPLYNKIIRKMMRLLRLITDGDIRIPIDFSYIKTNGKMISYITRGSSKHISREKYHLEKGDLDFFYKLVDVDFPFKRKFLQLAFENYEDSYESDNQLLSFLSLMIAMEALFNPADVELRYRISRNCAVLLGENEIESQEIFSTMRKLYDTRSKIIHTGEASGFDRENLSILRHYIRESIKKMLLCDESKDIILRKLSALGFGDFKKYNSIKLDV